MIKAKSTEMFLYFRDDNNKGWESRRSESKVMYIIWLCLANAKRRWIITIASPNCNGQPRKYKES